MESLSCLLIDEGAARVIPYCFPISRDWWLQLFSGTVGAIIGAIVAAIAAVWVLNRTNQKQQELWDASNESQRSRDNDAKIEQDKRDAQRATDDQAALTRQLEAQQAGIDQMIKNQIEQASIARQTSAAASLTGALMTMNHEVGKDIGRLLEARNEALQALNMWSIDLYANHESFRSVLHAALPLLSYDAISVSRAIRQQQSESDPVRWQLLEDLTNKERSTASRAVGRFIALYSQWLALPAEREHLEKSLRSVPAGAALWSIRQCGFVELKDLEPALRGIQPDEPAGHDVPPTATS